MLIKSSAESLELAFDRAEYCCKKLFKSEEGGRYNKWYCYGTEFGQNYAWFKVEHTDYSVRLSFEFMETGFVYVDGYFTNGSAYDKKTITSWKFENESEDETTGKVKDILDRFFDEGINVLRGEEVYNSRKPVKSALSKTDAFHFANSWFPYINDQKEFVKLCEERGLSEGTTKEYFDLIDELGFKTDKFGKYVMNSRKSVKSSRRPIKSSDADRTYEEYDGNRFAGIDGYVKWSEDNKVNNMIIGFLGKDKLRQFYNLTAGADVSTDGYCIKITYPNGDEFEVKSNNGMYELWYIGEDRVMHNLASISHYSPERFMKVLERALPYTQERRDAEDPLNNYGNSLNQSFVVGKQINNSKSYLCEDGTYHSENEMCRPEIKIFNSESDAEKFAKRSKSGFVQEL